MASMAVSSGLFPCSFHASPRTFPPALCSPGDVSQLWMLVPGEWWWTAFRRRSGCNISSRLSRSVPTLALAATLDAQGYSVNDIIHILMAEGGQA